MSLLGIDVGTTGCKAVAFNEEGEQLTSAYREYPLHSPQPGWAELDGNQVWDYVKYCIGKVASETKHDPITAMAVSCQGEAVSPVDQNGNILHNAIVSFDSRAESYVAGWEKKFGKQDIFNKTGHPLASMYTALKMQWLSENNPDVLKNTTALLGFEDLVMYRLGMPPTTDYTFQARSMYFNVNTCDWVDEYLDFAGLRREIMPELKPSGTLLGTISDSIADEIGLPHGVKVVVGGHDQPSQMLGAGVTESGVAAYGIGTVECIAPAFPNLLINDITLKNNICTYHHVCPGLYTALVYNFTGGSLFKWYRDQFGKDEQQRAHQTDQDVYDLMCSEASDKPSKLLVLPHFTTSGVPHFDTKTKGAILGLTLNTTKAEVTRALLEGLTYEMRMCVDLLKEAKGEIHTLRATGGGAKSAYWLQIKADIMEIPVAVPAVSEAGCLGVAMLAGSSTGVYNSVQEAAANVVKISRTFEPSSENREFYREQFQRYLDVYPTLKDLFHRMP